jgi:hypothetical protein
MPLDTLNNIKTRLGISSSSDDTLLGKLQDSADAFIANFCDRDFNGGTFTEYHPGGSEFVHVRNYPITSVTSVKIDPAHQFGPETLVAATTYVVHSERGVLQSLVGPFLPNPRSALVNGDIRGWTRGPRVIQVIYNTATDAVPNDIKAAYAQLIGHWYQQVKTSNAVNFQNLSQQKFGDTFAVYNQHTAGIPREITTLLAPYRS